MVNTIRNISKNNIAVGKNLLLLGMPKNAAGKPGMVYPIVEDKVNTFFTYLPIAKHPLRMDHPLNVLVLLSLI
jgi:hypothetical protein